MKPLAIVNPRAGGGRAGRALPELRPILERALGPADVVLTERRGHASDLARDAARAGRELVIAIGGDGTLSEVAGGVLEVSANGTSSTAVGYVGQGTGGDFRRSLGLEHRLDRYLAAIASGRERRIDAGHVTFTHEDGHEAGTEGSRWFINVLTAGIGGLVDRYVAGASRAMPGPLAYLTSTVRAVVETTPFSFACTARRGEVREEKRVRAYSVIIANGRWVGSGMHVAPHASVDDGLFDVLTMSAPSKLAFLALGAKVYGGTHIVEPGVGAFRCDAIDLALVDEPPTRRALLDIDGEPVGALPARVTIKPGALRFRG